MESLSVNIKDSFPSLLVLASYNDSEGFKLLLNKEGASSIIEVGIWYGRQNGSTEIVLEHKTPLMVAATYGSIDVMKVILSYHDVDVNFACGVNKSTALHYVASGGSANVVNAAKILISAGANVSCVDSNGNRPVDVIVVPPNMQGLKEVLEKLLLDNASGNRSVGNFSISVSVDSSSFGLLENGISLSYSPSVSPPSPVVDSKFT
jgi:ankyrin repeat protein